MKYYIQILLSIIYLYEIVWNIKCDYYKVQIIQIEYHN